MHDEIIQFTSPFPEDNAKQASEWLAANTDCRVVCMSVVADHGADTLYLAVHRMQQYPDVLAELATREAM